MENKGLPAIEQQIFEWEGWGKTGAPGSLEFEGITLKVDVGEHKAGTKFDAAFLCSSNATVALRNYNEAGAYIYRLIVSVGEQVTEEQAFGKHPDNCDCVHDHSSN